MPSSHRTAHAPRRQLYHNRPICYSLGNFIFTLETIPAFRSRSTRGRHAIVLDAADLYDDHRLRHEKRFWEPWYRGSTCRR